VCVPAVPLAATLLTFLLSSAFPLSLLLTLSQPAALIGWSCLCLNNHLCNNGMYLSLFLPV
jgi:hypothetical protein